MLGEQVRGINCAIDLSKIDPSASHRLLYPEQVRIEVPELAEALTTADTNRR